VQIARGSALAEIRHEEYAFPKVLPMEFGKRTGVFVTVLEHPGRGLRACIGYPEPVMPLMSAISASAEGAVHDPRFPTLTEGDVESCVFEVTVMTPPEEIIYESEDDLKSQIVIGRDGLIIEHMLRKGLFLPQVPVEQGWDIDEYLGHLCQKAGLRYDAWHTGHPVFKRFTGEIYSEDVPHGTVTRREI
jgi:uncharacterized protein (TIGR00296 family)